MWLVGLTDFCCGPHPAAEMVESFLSEKKSDFGSAVKQLGGSPGAGLPGVFSNEVVWVCAGVWLSLGKAAARVDGRWVGGEHFLPSALLWHGARTLSYLRACEVGFHGH